jgi:hypothetical protein
VTPKKVKVAKNVTAPEHSHKETGNATLLNAVYNLGLGLNREVKRVETLFIKKKLQRTDKTV